jgi:hypothetical protein
MYLASFYVFRFFKILFSQRTRGTFSAVSKSDIRRTQELADVRLHIELLLH